MSTSRRDFLTASAAGALAALLGRPALGRAFGQEPVFTPLRRNVGIFTMRGGTVAYLVDAGGVAVVDSQFPPEAKLLLAGIDARSGKRPVDFLLNTHHHPDHTAGNVVFRDVAKKVVAHATASEHMRQPPGGKAPGDAVFPDTTFTERWLGDAGDERIGARHYGRAHTSGDAVITFERANVTHMGDLVFHRRHPIVDRAAGASIRNWITVLERAVRDHAADTVYVFGHAGTGSPVTGAAGEVMGFRDYLGALLEFVEQQVRAGRSREEVMALRGPLKGFESYGPFGAENPREALTAAYEEVTSS